MKNKYFLINFFSKLFRFMPQTYKIGSKRHSHDTFTKHSPKPAKNMKIKDLMKSDVDFQYSKSKALTLRALVPNGMPQLQIL